MDAILCQDGLQTKFSNLRKSRGSVRGNIKINFTLDSHFLCPLESYVVYNWNSIIISALVVLKRASQSEKNDDVLFFFSSLGRQPTNRGPVRHSDPGTPLAWIWVYFFKTWCYKYLIFNIYPSHDLEELQFCPSWRDIFLTASLHKSSTTLLASATDRRASYCGPVGLARNTRIIHHGLKNLTEWASYFLQYLSYIPSLTRSCNLGDVQDPDVSH